MTPCAPPPATKSLHRFAGRSAIGSGIFGLLAFGLLMTALYALTDTGLFTKEQFFGYHDIGAILQSLCLIPVPFALRKLSREHSAGVSRTLLTVGVASFSSTAILLLVGIIHYEWGTWYMVPQGIVGGWVLVVGWRMGEALPLYLRWLGAAVGLGLVLVGTVPLAYALLVAPVDPESVADVAIHRIVWIGTYLGVTTYPIWAILLGCTLLRVKN